MEMRVICISTNFYPRSPCGERPWQRGSRVTYVEFLSTLSLRRATPMTFRHCTTYLFLSTLSLRRATRGWTLNINGSMISIHALLAESDGKINSVLPGSAISIHALLAESDFTSTITICIVSKFLSTLSLRRATTGQKRLRQKLAISIHALLAESDDERCKFSWNNGNFYPRSGPAWLASCFNFYPRSPCGERR